MKEISLHVDPQNRAKFGRRMTIVEALLGINIAPFSDGTRVMVAGFVPDRDAAKNSQIKIGDCVKSINATEVTHQTINAFLERITEPQNVTVQLQRIAGVDVTRNSDFVRQLTAPNANEDEILSEILCNYPVGVLYLKTEGLTETGPEYDGVLYCYPKPMNRNVLCSSRGTFLTLHHLLPEAIKTKPHISTILMNHLLTHVAYHSSGDKLLIMAFPDMRCSSFEALRITNEVVKCLEFCYGSLDEGFERFRTQADGFFSRFFARLITSGTWYDAVQKIDLNELKDLKQAPVQFENLLPAATYVALPREAQMQLDDALNELESGDYRDWVRYHLMSYAVFQCRFAERRSFKLPADVHYRRQRFLSQRVFVGVALEPVGPGGCSFVLSPARDVAFVVHGADTVVGALAEGLPGVVAPGFGRTDGVQNAGRALVFANRRKREGNK